MHVVGDDVLGLECFPTPGHASHHVCYLDPDGTLYAGDAAGVRIQPGRYVMPPTPPPDIDVEGWQRTIDEIERRAPERLALDPLRRRRRPGVHLARLRLELLDWAEFVLGGATEDEFVAYCRTELADAGEDARHVGNAMPFWQSYQGLKRWADKQAGSGLDAVTFPSRPRSTRSSREPNPAVDRHDPSRRLAAHGSDLVRLGGRPRAPQHGGHARAPRLSPREPARLAHRARGRQLVPPRHARWARSCRSRKTPTCTTSTGSRSATPGKPYRKRDRPRFSAWVAAGALARLAAAGLSDYGRGDRGFERAHVVVDHPLAREPLLGRGRTPSARARRLRRARRPCRDSRRR